LRGRGWVVAAWWRRVEWSAALLSGGRLCG
jgi:hypothetical protein